MRPVVRNTRAPLDIIRPVPVKRRHWRPLCLSKEKVSSNVSLLNLLQFIRDLAQNTRPVVPVFCAENIHYRICKMMHGGKKNCWNVRVFLRSPPIYILYGFWHAYKFCVTQTFRSFWPIVTFLCKGLLRSGETVPCLSKADHDGGNRRCTAVGYGNPHTAPQQEMSLPRVGPSSESAKSSSVRCL